MSAAKVWAPTAQSVEIHVRPPRAPHDSDPDVASMERTEDGWWVGPRLEHGTDYAYVVDGNGPFPDPRSPWQPRGVHGFSRAFGLCDEPCAMSARRP